MSTKPEFKNLTFVLNEPKQDKFPCETDLVIKLHVNSCGTRLNIAHELWTLKSLAAVKLVIRLRQKRKWERRVPVCETADHDCAAIW